MPGGRTKFSNAWFSDVDSNGQRLGSWCHKGVHDHMLTVGFVIVSFFVTTMEKHRYCSKLEKQSNFKPINLQWMTQRKLFVLQGQPSAHVSNRCDLREHRGSSSGQLSIINYKNASLQAEVIW